MKVKKIAALAVGAAMVGATLGFASAQPTVQDNIPKDFFVKDGQPNVKIVVGSQGAAMDVASAADIAVAIGSLLYTEKDVEASVASVVVKKDIATDPDDIDVFNNYYVGMSEDAYTKPSDYPSAWAFWYGVGVPEGVPKDVTLNINGEDVTIPIGGSETIDGHTYTVKKLTDDGILLLDVDGKEYALKQGELQVLDVNFPGYLKLPVSVDPAELKPYVQMDIHTNPDIQLDSIQTDADDVQLLEGDVLTSDLTQEVWTDYEFTFNATYVDAVLNIANVTINWTTAGYVNKVQIIPTTDSTVSPTGLQDVSSATGITIENITVGDRVIFYTDEGIFDFQVIEFGKINENDYVRVNFDTDHLTNGYANLYKTNSFPPSSVLDLHEAEAQEHVSIYVYAPATLTFSVLDVNPDDNNVMLQIDSIYYDGDETQTAWSSGPFVMLEQEQQHKAVPGAGGDIVFDLYVDFVANTVNSVPLKVGDDATLQVGDSFVVGSFKFTVLSADPVNDEYVIQVSDADPKDGINVEEATLTIHSSDLDTDRVIYFTTTAVEFKSVGYETTYIGYDYGRLEDSEWSDGSWDVPVSLTVPNFAEWETSDDTWTEAASIEIGQIKFDKWDIKDGVPPESGVLVIPKNALKITVDLGYGEVQYSYTDKFGFTKTGSYIDMGGNDVPGARVGDSITFKPFDKTVSILEIGDDYFVYGHDYGTAWYKVGDEKTFDGYTFKVLDINIFEQKVLIQFSAPGMDTVTESIKVGETYTYGGLQITVDDAFIGSTQDVIAKLHVSVAQGKVISGSEKYSLVDGYITKLYIGEDSNGKYIDKVEFVNTDDIKGNEINVFNTYKIYYSYDSSSETYNDETRYAIHAKVAIDPYQPVWYTQELGLGDMIYDENGNPTGYIIDNVTFSVDPTKAAQPAKVTTPITVLDIEIMEAGLDSVDSNLILVGGPVVNQVTAALADKLGVPTTYDEWAADENLKAGVVKYVESIETIGGYGVVLVAGADRDGTKAAAEALMEYIANLS